MRRLLAAVAAASSLLLTVGVAYASVPLIGSVIGGRVVDSLNLGPLGGVRVDVFADSGSASKIVRSTTTAKDGTFAVAGLGRGSYHLELEKRGYALEVVTGFSLKNDERFFMTNPVGMRTAVVTIGVGRAMESRL